MLKIHLEIVTGKVFKFFWFFFLLLSSFFFPPSTDACQFSEQTGNLWFKTLESLYVFRQYCVLNFSGGLAMWWLYIQIWRNKQTVVGGAGFLLHHKISFMTGNIYFSMHPPTRANQSHLGTPGPGYSQALASGYRTLAAHVINLAHLAAPLPASPAVPQVQLTHSSRTGGKVGKVLIWQKFPRYLYVWSKTRLVFVGTSSNCGPGVIGPAGSVLLCWHCYGPRISSQANQGGMHPRFGQL